MFDTADVRGGKVRYGKEQSDRSRILGIWLSHLESLQQGRCGEDWRERVFYRNDVKPNYALNTACTALSA